MRVLYVATRSPIGILDGETLRTFHLVNDLAKKCELILACPYDQPEEGGTAEITAATGAKQVIELKARKRTLWTWVMALLRLEPHFFSVAKDSNFDSNLRSGALGHFDAIYLDGLVSFNYYEAARAVSSRVVVDLRDAWTLLYERIANSSSGIKKALVSIKRKIVSRIERKIVRRAKTLLVISDVDRDYLSRRYRRDQNSIMVIPNGVCAMAEMESSAESGKDEKVCIVFTGAMDYFPNIQAAEYLIEQVVPRLRERGLSYRLFIVGRRPPSSLQNRQDSSVIVTGTVPNVASYLRMADIVLAPLLSGAGLKNKVLEGLISEKPLIGSPIAFEGIPLEVGRHALMAASTDEWVDMITLLSDNPKKRKEIGEEGARFVREHFSWESIHKKMESLLLEN